MKYIRTEETIFEVVDENDLIYKVVAKNKKNTYSKSKCQTNVVSQAETIEELFDEFIVNDSKPHILRDIFLSGGRMAGKTPQTFGAIWIVGKFGEPILKSVAKMKGVLPNGEIDWELL